MAFESDVLVRHLQQICILIHILSIYPPVSHCIPLHPISQVQVSGAVQVPPFWQGRVQVAKAEKWRFATKHTEHVTELQSNQHTGALRHTPTPLSVELAGSTV